MQFLQEAQYLASRLDRREVSRVDFAIAFSRLMTSAVGVQRTGVWVFGTTDDDPTLMCLGSHDTVLDGPVGHGHCMGSRADFLRALDLYGAVCASRASTHPATARLYEGCLAQHGIESLMAVAFSINGELHGAFTCTTVGVATQWTAHQLATLKRLVARVSPALARAEMRAPDTGRVEFLPAVATPAAHLDFRDLRRRQALQG